MQQIVYYVIELQYRAQEAHARNTCKLSLNKPNPTLQPRFGSFYMYLEGCKKGFLAGRRPFIGVDEYHSKTKYGGQLLIAMEKDPNNQYFPLAFVVVKIETKKS